MGEVRAHCHDIRPAGHVTGIVEIPGGEHRAVRLKAVRMSTGCADGNNVRPFRDIALAVIVAACGNNSAVFFQAYGMGGTRAHCHDIRPVGHVFGVADTPGGEHRAIRFQTYGTKRTRAYCSNVCPSGDIALTFIIIPDGNDRAVRSQSDRMFARRTYHRLVIRGYGFTCGGKLFRTK